MPYADKERQRASQRAYYEANKEKYRASTKVLARKQKEDIRSHKTSCQACGESHPATLSFHHRDPSTKEFTIGVSGSRRFIAKDRLLAEIAKCDVLCHNCHAKLHWNECH